MDEIPVSAGEDDVRHYLSEIRQYPRLTPQQERDLAMRCAAGDEDAIRTMVNSNLRLVVSMAREYAGRGIPLLDLIQEGSIGLLIAAKKFDYTLEYRFSTYATKWIRQGITRCIMNHAGLIRVPVHTSEKVRKVLAARASLQQENGSVPDEAELAVQTGISEDKIRQLLRLVPEVRSLDAAVSEDDDNTLKQLVEDDTAAQPYKELVRQELKHTMDALIGLLNSRQQRILQLRFGMEDDVCHSLEEIGKILGISKERVRQIEHQAMDKLRSLGAGLGLEDFLE